MQLPLPKTNDVFSPLPFNANSTLLKSSTTS